MPRRDRAGWSDARDAEACRSRACSSAERIGFGGGVDLSLQVAFGKLRAGAVAQRSQRKFSARRFRYVFYGDDTSVLLLPARAALHRAAHRRVVHARGANLPLRYLRRHLLAPRSSLLAGYAGADVSILDPFRIVAGVRYEHAIQGMEPNSPYAITSTKENGTKRTDSDVRPSVNLVYALTDAMNLRAGYSYTLVRPQFRELAPFLYFDFTRRRSVSGNPLLEETRIHNADPRWEWFAGEGEVFATSVFFKQFINPIEQVIVSASLRRRQLRQRSARPGARRRARGADLTLPDREASRAAARVGQPHAHQLRGGNRSRPPG